MTTGRTPRYPVDEFDATIDDESPVDSSIGMALEDVSDAPTPPSTPMSTGERRRMALGPDRALPVTLEAVDMANTEWARELEGRLVAAEGKVAAAVARSAKTERWIAIGLRIAAGSLGLIGVGVIAVLRLAMASGERTAIERQHIAEHAETRAGLSEVRLVTMPELRATIAANAQSIANLRGTIDMLSRLGAVRVQGPAPQPLIPGGQP